MITQKKTLYKWFSNFMKPAQEHFRALIDSFWHKNEQIPMSNIEGLSLAIEGTASAKQLLNHLDDTNAHRALFDELKKQIQAIQTILQVDDVNLDTLQEIVTELKSNAKLQELIDKKVNKEEGKGLSSNDFTNEFKEKLKKLSPFTGKFLSSNLIKGNTEKLSDSVYGTGATYKLSLEEPIKVGQYLVSYIGHPLGNNMSIKMVDNEEKEIVTTLLYEETDNFGATTYYYLLNNEKDVNTGLPPYSYYTNSIKVEFGGGKPVKKLQLRKFETYPIWEPQKSLYTSLGAELSYPNNIVQMGRCNFVNANGYNREITVYYEENSLFSVAKIGNDEGKITFSCIRGEIEGNPEITGKIGSRAEGICTGGKVYITVYNRE